MKSSSFSPYASGRRRLLAAAGAVLALLLLAGIGTYGLLTGPRTPGTPRATASTTDRKLAAPVPSDGSPGSRTVPDTDDPVLFARHIAEALFTWDTASGLTLVDYTSAILATADPTGNEQAGLASDIAGHLPSADAWTTLRQYATRQSLTIDEVVIPAVWEDAQAQAQPGQIPTGAIAFTIDGTRHRTGIWNDEPVTAQRPVAFTVFIVCPPRDDRCHLLRLSVLDEPLR